MNKRRILVVDDEPQLSDLVRLFLQKTNRYTVRVVNDSAQALPVAREFMPDAIVLDVNMPGKDGGEVAHEITLEPGLCNIPILFLTGLAAPAETGSLGTTLGGMVVLAKPFNPRALVAAVDRAIARPPVAV